jgi:protein O-mannosyl-transferase
VFDNASAIAEDPRIRESTAHNVRLILSQDYWYNRDNSGLYRPIVTLSYLMNYAVLGNGARPAGYHWVNLALHGVNVALVYVLGWLIFEDAALAWALAAIWGLHPLLTESVTNIVGRADLLAGFGVLAGLLCYERLAIFDVALIVLRVRLNGLGERLHGGMVAALFQGLQIFSAEVGGAEV